MKQWRKWALHVAALGIGSWAFACSDGGQTTPTTTGAAGGNGGMGGESQASSSNASVSSSGVAVSSSASVGAGGFGGGGSMTFVCDPPAEPGSLYEHSVISYDIKDIEPVSMCKYRGKVGLIVNTAAV